jgi:glycosyltransferase involved in cell wall biosynthesis
MSEYVKKLILKCNNSINIEIIKLGSSVNYINNNNYKDYSEYKILTVAGIVPHKNQLLIAKTCRYLIKKNIKFNWLIVGPIRNARYYQKLIKVIKKNKLENVLKIITSAKVDEVKAAYRNANLYSAIKRRGILYCSFRCDNEWYSLIGSNVGDIYIWQIYKW